MFRDPENVPFYQVVFLFVTTPSPKNLDQIVSSFFSIPVGISKKDIIYIVWLLRTAFRKG
jgi:hypothetical protein